MFMDWMSTANGLIALLTAFCGLIGTGVSTYFAIKNFVTAAKEKSKREIWEMATAVADAAMREAERTGQCGADKKTMVIEVVKSSLKAAGLDIDDFLDQLGDYIDSAIEFVNNMNAIADEDVEADEEA